MLARLKCKLNVIKGYTVSSPSITKSQATSFELHLRAAVVHIYGNDDPLNRQVNLNFTAYLYPGEFRKADILNRKWLRVINPFHLTNLLLDLMRAGLLGGIDTLDRKYRGVQTGSSLSPSIESSWFARWSKRVVHVFSKYLVRPFIGFPLKLLGDVADLLIFDRLSEIVNLLGRCCGIGLVPIVPAEIKSSPDAPPPPLQIQVTYPPASSPPLTSPELIAVDPKSPAPSSVTPATPSRSQRVFVDPIASINVPPPSPRESIADAKVSPLPSPRGSAAAAVNPNRRTHPGVISTLPELRALQKEIDKKRKDEVLAHGFVGGRLFFKPALTRSTSFDKKTEAKPHHRQRSRSLGANVRELATLFVSAGREGSVPLASVPAASAVGMSEARRASTLTQPI